ncbi:hypothetical protein Tco_0666095 [Tanacetum coccineum]
MDVEHGSEKMKSPEKIEEEDIYNQEEEVPIEVESLSTKFPIMDWKTCVLTENFMYYQIFREDGSSKNYKILSEMLKDFDRQDVEELYRLVKERYSTSRPEGYDLMLWGDLHTLFEPDEEDKLWKNQHEYNVISWSLYDFCGIHILLMQNGIAIHMLTEKKYPLSQEMISKMLKKKLEVDHESSQAFELLSTNGVSTASTNLVLPELVNTARRKINTADDQKGKGVLKDDKATGTEIIHALDKENDNVEVVLNKPKNKNLKEKGKHGTSSVGYKGRKGSTSKKGSGSKSTKTNPCKVLNFIDDSSSDAHGTMFRGKPGRSSVYSKVSLTDVVKAKKPPPVRNYILGLASLKT